MLKRVAILIGSCLCLATAAHAQVSRNVEWSKRNDGWAKVQISPGCHLIWFGENRIYRQIDSITPDNRVDVVVQGSCNANGLAEGRVRIETTVHFPPTNVASEAEYHYLGWRTVREGTARNGLLQGVVRMWDFESVQGNPGVWETPIPGFPEGLDNFFKDGCEYSFDERTGQIGYPVTEGSHWGECKPEGGQLLLAELGAEPEAPPQTSPSPAARLLPVTPAPAPAAGADAWARCVSGPVRRDPDGGIQVLWDLHNSCTTPVIVSYCFRARFEAAGDPNLCRRQEMRTHEIAAQGKLTFDFNLMPAGTALSDGRTVTSNSLIVSGFACTGGSFPDAYFDSDGSFRSRGC